MCNPIKLFRYSSSSRMALPYVSSQRGLGVPPGTFLRSWEILGEWPLHEENWTIPVVPLFGFVENHVIAK